MKDTKNRLLTIDIADLKAQIENAEGNVTIIAGPGVNPDLANLLLSLETLKLHQIVAKKDSNLEGVNIQLDYYDINIIAVDTINIQPDEDHMIINGEIKIPKGLKAKGNIVSTFYTSEEDAVAVANALNDYTNSRVEKMISMMQKSLQFRQSVASKQSANDDE